MLWHVVTTAGTSANQIPCIWTRHFCQDAFDCLETCARAFGRHTICAQLSYWWPWRRCDCCFCCRPLRFLLSLLPLLPFCFRSRFCFRARALISLPYPHPPLCCVLCNAQSWARASADRHTHRRLRIRQLFNRDEDLFKCVCMLRLCVIKHKSRRCRCLLYSTIYVMILSNPKDLARDISGGEVLVRGSYFHATLTGAQPTSETLCTAIEAYWSMMKRGGRTQFVR